MNSKRIKQLFIQHDLLILIMIAAIFRSIAVIYSQGFNHPDELFHVLEPAHGIVTGYWLKAWEWQDGLRSFTLPGFFSIFIMIGKAIGITDPNSMATLMRSIAALLSLSGVWAVYKITNLFADKTAARMATLFMAIWWVPVYFGVKTMSGPISMNIILISHYLAYRAINIPNFEIGKRTNQLLLYAGMLGGLAFSIRFQMGIFSVAIAAVLLYNKAIKQFLIYSAGVVLLVLLHGMMDLYTLGSFLHSPIQYFISQIIENQAVEQFGAQPWHRYLTWYIRYFTLPFALFLLFFTIRSGKQFWQLIVSILLFWGLFQAVAHREDRFLIPMVPFLIMTTSLGFTCWIKDKKSIAGKVVTILTILSFIGGGTYKYFKHRWSNYTDILTIYTSLNKDQAAKGVAIIGFPIGHTGGYFYLDRKIPMIQSDTLEGFDENILPLIPKTINRIVTPIEIYKIQDKLSKIGVSCKPSGHATYSCEKI